MSSQQTEMNGSEWDKTKYIYRVEFKIIRESESELSATRILYGEVTLYFIGFSRVLEILLHRPWLIWLWLVRMYCASCATAYVAHSEQRCILIDERFLLSFSFSMSAMCIGSVGDFVSLIFLVSFPYPLFVIIVIIIPLLCVNWRFAFIYFLLFLFAQSFFFVLAHRNRFEEKKILFQKMFVRKLFASLCSWIWDIVFVDHWNGIDMTDKHVAINSKCQ